MATNQLADFDFTADYFNYVLAVVQTRKLLRSLWLPTTMMVSAN